jgi:phosphatidylcholine synthase
MVPSKIVAFSVHVFTASGAALGFAALLAAVERQWALMFWLLGAALFVDGIDGTLARKARVVEVLPRWSGETLDLIIDFVTYVLVPAYAIAAGGLLPDALAIPAGILIVVSSAIYFADREMKTADNYFRGFPALWNAAAFYLFLLKPAPWIAAAAIVALAVATFMPFKFLHPFRVKRLRFVTIAALAVWALLGAVALIYNFAPGPMVSAGLVAIALYFVAVGLIDPWMTDDRSSV